MTWLASLLRRHSLVAIDTSVFIYQVESNPRYVDLTDRVFAWIESPGCAALTSTITMTELPVQPYRDSNAIQVRAFWALLSTYPHLQWMAPSLEIAAAAARLRAQYDLRTPDALQAATAVVAGASALIANDASFRRIREFETLLLDDLI